MYFFFFFTFMTNFSVSPDELSAHLLLPQTGCTSILIISTYIDASRTIGEANRKSILL